MMPAALRSPAAANLAKRLVCVKLASAFHLGLKARLSVPALLPSEKLPTMAWTVTGIHPPLRTQSTSRSVWSAPAFRHHEFKSAGKPEHSKRFARFAAAGD